MIPDELKRLKPLTGKERLGADRDSEYMGAEDIDPEVEPVLTIQAIYNGMVTLSRGKEKKDVMVFAEETVPGIKTVRPLIVNATNRKTLRKLFKNVTAETLVGKKIQLYLEHNVRDPQTGDKVDGIRIRPSVPKTATYVPPTCEACGKPISGLQNYTPEQIAATNKQRYGKCLCVECGQKRKAEIEAEKKAQEEAAQAALAQTAPAAQADEHSVSEADEMLAALRAEVEA